MRYRGEWCYQIVEALGQGVSDSGDLTDDRAQRESGLMCLDVAVSGSLGAPNVLLLFRIMRVSLVF